MKKNKGGQPTKMTPQTLQLLKEAFLIGCTDREACLYAEIAPATLYNYQERHSEYIEQKAQWKDNPVLKARKIVITALDRNDKETAKWYLERKAKSEFSQRSEMTGKDGEELKGLIIVKDGSTSK